MTLPDAARLKLYKLEDYTAKPLEEFSLCDVKGSGALYQVTMAAKGLRKSKKDQWKDLSYMEACMRAYIGRAKEPLMLSSGLEDYFLGTYYFNSGRYATPVAGLTHFDPKQNEFSAYRFHEDDPVFFHNGLRLTCRCGEKIGDKVFHDPPRRATRRTPGCISGRQLKNERSGGRDWGLPATNQLPGSIGSLSTARIPQDRPSPGSTHAQRGQAEWHVPNGGCIQGDFVK